MKGRSASTGTRVFLALDPPAEVRAEAEAWARHIARSTEGLRVVPARNSHITLAFLGQRDPGEIESALRATDEALIPETEDPVEVTGLSLGAPAWLPKRRPRTLVLDIHDDLGQLAGLHSRLARQLDERLDWRESRPYRPHLTCARTGRGFDALDRRLPVSPSLGFEAGSVTLYASILRPEGAEYEVLERFPLGPQ